MRLSVAEPTSRPIVRSWKIADFEPLLSVGLEGYRDFDNGRSQFSNASCQTCHRFAGAGPEFAVAPDLSRTAKTHSPQELLEAILSPGAAIAADATVQVFEMADGLVIEGLIAEVSDVGFLVSPDPRKPDQTVLVKKSAITSQRRSATSAMPPELLDTLGEDDVLDLVAYLLSGGDKTDPVFKH